MEPESEDETIIEAKERVKEAVQAAAAGTKVKPVLGFIIEKRPEKLWVYPIHSIPIG